MNNNMKEDVVMAFFHIFSDIFGRTKIQKLLFLMERETKEDIFDFELRHYGPFSDILNSLIDNFVDNNLLDERKVLTHRGTYGYHYHITDKGKNMAQKSFNNLNDNTRIEITQLHDRFKNSTPTEIVRYVYTNYPKWNPHNISDIS